MTVFVDADGCPVVDITVKISNAVILNIAVNIAFLHYIGVFA